MKWSNAFVACVAFTSISLQTAIAGPKIERVLLISIDGLHAIDLERYAAGHPTSALAGLSAHGLTYSKALTTMPSDSFPGLLAILTGGSPRTTGVWYDVAFGNDLADPKSCVPGQVIAGASYDYSEAINISQLTPLTTIDSDKLVADPRKRCAPVFPHMLSRVNTVFDIAKAAGKRTAWIDKHPSYDLVQGPTGRAVDDLFTPEIAAGGVTDSIEMTIAYDANLTNAIINQIRGLDHGGKVDLGVPSIFGMSFQAVSVAQKKVGNGYLNADAEPSPGLTLALDATDTAIASLRAALIAASLERSTLIIVTAKHGQSPIDPTKRQIVNRNDIRSFVEAELPGTIAFVTTDNVALIWLKDKSKVAAVTSILERKHAELAIDRIYSGASLAANFGDPAADPRTPDIIIQPKVGVIYARPRASKIAEHGGGTIDDRNVALLVSNPALTASKINDAVLTTQVAPTILLALGLSSRDLDAVRLERTPPLPHLIDALSEIGAKP